MFYEDLKWLDIVLDLFDICYCIFGMNIWFGVDFLLGFIFGVGDVFIFGIFGLLVLVMVCKGVSGMVFFKMIGNIVLDVIVGVIFIFGDFFDFGYKVNCCNFYFMEEYYKEGRY